MRTRCWCLILLSLVALPAARAEQPIADGVLTLDEAWNLVLEHSPQYFSQQRLVEAAKFRKASAAGDMMPSIVATARYTRLSEVEAASFDVPGLGTLSLGETITDTYGFGVELTQPLFAGFALLNARRIAALSLDVSRQQQRDVRNQLRVSLEEAYFNEIAAHSMMTAIDDALKNINSHRTLISRMAEVGLATRLDMAQVETRLAELELQRVQVDSMERLSRLTLHFLTGIPENSRFSLVSDWANEEPQGEPLDRMVEQALFQRPDILALQQATEIAGVTAKIQASAFYPTVAARFSYQNDRPNDRIFPVEDAFADTWDASVVFSWNLFHGFAERNRTRAADRNYESAVYKLQQAREAVVLDISAHWLAYRSAVQSLAAAGTALHAAEEALRVARDRYQVGDATSTEVLDAQASLTQAEFQQIQAKTDIRLAGTQLARSLGQDL